jgi:cobyrinic acid a,c-diamide synthase
VAAAALIIGAACSGAGKTTLTLALLAALRRRGLRVRAAKSGPDYIDPGFHAAATGAPCPNLDSWAMAPTQLDAVAAELANDTDLVLIESAMGLFDGVAAEPGRGGAAADLAIRYRLPVVLVLDVSGQSQSAAAVARGFMLHDAAVRIGGVVLNRVGSDRHRDGILRAFAPLGLPVLGSLPRQGRVPHGSSIALPERHLGLVQAMEHARLDDLLAQLANLAERHLDVDAILAMAAPLTVPASTAPMLVPPGQYIALAHDAAFSFVYPHLLSNWCAGGAEIVPFSPLADEPPQDRCDTCWLPGGYPELHCARLAAAGRFRAGMISFAKTRKVHGECGGYMVLGRMLQDANGQPHPMLGLLSHTTSFAQRRLHLGYREATLLQDSALGSTGCILRGHEFHYAGTVDPGTDEPLVSLSDPAGKLLGRAGGRRGTVSGAFFHVIAAVPPTGGRR